MKSTKFLFAIIFMIGFVGVSQVYAQADVFRGEEYKPLTFEIDGVNYLAEAHMEYQVLGTPSRNVNWVAHGYLVSIEMEENGIWIPIDYMPIKKTVKADDPRDFVSDDEKVTINRTGRVTVHVLLKDMDPWWN